MKVFTKKQIAKVNDFCEEHDSNMDVYKGGTQLGVIVHNKELFVTKTEPIFSMARGFKCDGKIFTTLDQLFRYLSRI